MKTIKLILRFIAALIVPFVTLIVIFWLGDSKLYPDCFIRLNDGRNLIAVLSAGFAGGYCFTSVAYSIAPYFKKVFVVVEVLVAFVWFLFAMTICRQRGIPLTKDWVPWARVILCGVGMVCPFLVMLQKKLKGE